MKISSAVHRPYSWRNPNGSVIYITFGWISVCLLLLGQMERTKSCKISSVGTDLPQHISSGEWNTGTIEKSRRKRDGISKRDASQCSSQYPHQIQIAVWFLTYLFFCGKTVTFYSERYSSQYCIHCTMSFCSRYFGLPQISVTGVWPATMSYDIDGMMTDHTVNIGVIIHWSGKRSGHCLTYHSWMTTCCEEKLARVCHRFKSAFFKRSIFSSILKLLLLFFGL